MATQQVFTNYLLVSDPMPSSEDATPKKAQPLLSRTSEEDLGGCRRGHCTARHPVIREAQWVREPRRRSTQSSFVETAKFVRRTWQASRGVKDGGGRRCVGKSVVDRGNGLCKAWEESQYGMFREIKSKPEGLKRCV